MNKTKKKGGKEDEKKRALEKLLERHWTCPSCRAPIADTAEDKVFQLRRKAEQGHSWAQCMLGEQYRDGRGVRKDARQAERWFRAAMTDMSVMDGGPEAASILGHMFAEGDGVGKDVEKAKAEVAAVKAEDSKAALLLGVVVFYHLPFRAQQCDQEKPLS